jgi:hypothetical protein
MPMIAIGSPTPSGFPLATCLSVILLVVQRDVLARQAEEGRASRQLSLRAP